MKRKEILPTWIRFFSWIFLCFYLSPIVFVIGLFGGEIDYNVFGFTYKGTTSLHPVPIFGTLLFTLAATVAYGILWGKDWAIKLGIIYAFIALITSGTSFLYHFTQNHLSIRLEFLFIIPFLISLHKKRKKWEAYNDAPNIQ